MKLSALLVIIISAAAIWAKRKKFDLEKETAIMKKRLYFSDAISIKIITMDKEGIVHSIMNGIKHKTETRKVTQKDHNACVNALMKYADIDDLKLFARKLNAKLNKLPPTDRKKVIKKSQLTD
jgi:hypothetical protein